MQANTITYPSSSLDAFFADELQPISIRSQNFGLSGIIESIQRFNNIDASFNNTQRRINNFRESTDNDAHIISKFDAIIDRLDTIIRNNSVNNRRLFNFGRFGQTGLGSSNLQDGLRSAFSGFRLTQSTLNSSFERIKSIFNSVYEKLSSTFNNIKQGFDSSFEKIKKIPENFINFLKDPIDAFINQISRPFNDLKRSITSIFSDAGSIIAAPFRAVGNMVSWLFNDKKGYPFDKLEQDLSVTNNILKTLEDVIKNILVGNLQASLSKITDIDEKLNNIIVGSSLNEVRQIETDREQALLENRRMDEQNDLLTVIAERLEGTSAGEGSGESSGQIGPRHSMANLALQAVKRFALPAIGLGLGLSAANGISDIFAQRQAGEQVESLDYLSSFGQGVAGGAALGSMFGPWGALIGAGAGGLLSGGSLAIAALTPSQKEAEEKRNKNYENKENEEAIKSLENRNILNRNIFGESKIDETKLESLSAKELRALISLNDFSIIDMQKIKKAYEKISKLEEQFKVEEQQRTAVLKEESKKATELKYSNISSAEAITKLETERSRIIDQLKTAKASENQIRQVNETYDKKILELKQTSPVSINPSIPEASIRKPTDLISPAQLNVASEATERSALREASMVGAAIGPTVISSASTASGSSVVVNAPSTTVNTVRGNTFTGVKPTISMNN